jgi:hypothetical protein
MGEVLSNYKTLFTQQSRSEDEMILGSVCFAMIGAMIATAGALLAGGLFTICMLVYIGGGLTTIAASVAFVMQQGDAGRDSDSQMELA